MMYKAIMGDGIIESDNLIFRPIDREDTDIVLKWRNSDNVKKNFLYRQDITKQEHLSWLTGSVDEGKVIQYIIIEKADNKPIGSVYVRDIDREAMEGEYGIFIGEGSARGKGYGSETAKCIVRHFFVDLKFHRLFLRVLVKNEIAIKSYESAGFRIEYGSEEMMQIDGKQEKIVFMTVYSDAYHM